MSDELVKRLRAQNSITATQAADRIEALEAELAEAKGDAASLAWAGDRVKALEAENLRLHQIIRRPECPMDAPCNTMAYQLGQFARGAKITKRQRERLFEIAALREALTASSGEPSAEDYEEYIPAGHHIVEDADGARYVKNPEPRAADEAERMFPIMGGDDIPWAVIAPHADRAKRNHGQTLERLAERGGLSSVEALWVIRDQSWNATLPTEDDANKLAEIVRAAQRQENDGD